VLNQAVQVDAELAELINEFATFMFDRFNGLRKISFRYIEIEKPVTYKVWRVWDAERTDVLLKVPARVEDYVQGLGKHTRHNIRRYMKRLTDDHPSFEVRVLERQEISEPHLHALFRHSAKRLSDKTGMTGEGEAEFGRVKSMAKACGFVCVVIIHDQISAGVICYRLGENFSFRLVGHDTNYDKYSLGFLIYYITICECIKVGGRTLNLGWGEYPYKLRLGGIARNLSHLDIYTSEMHANLDLVAKCNRRISVIKQNIKQDIKELANRNEGLPSSAARAVLHLYRRRKRLLTALPGLVHGPQSLRRHPKNRDTHSSEKQRE
jgi:hypothetical protein